MSQGDRRIDFWSEFGSLLHLLRSADYFSAARALVQLIPNGETDRHGIDKVRSSLQALKLDPCISALEGFRDAVEPLETYYGQLDALDQDFAPDARVQVSASNRAGFPACTGTILTGIPLLGTRMGQPCATWIVRFDVPQHYVWEPELRHLEAEFESSDLRPAE
jgi:hypothetical protein